MRYKTFVSSVLVALSIPCFCDRLRADDPTDLTEPKSAAANKAKIHFRDALKKLDDEHEANVKKVREEYFRDLDDARKVALEKNDLDEAQRILGAKISAQEDEKTEQAPVRGFKILYARWGTKASWNDVTKPVRELVKGSKLAFVPEHAGFPDPIVGNMKSLVVVYTLNGRVGLVVAGGNDLVDVPPPVRRR